MQRSEKVLYSAFGVLFGIALGCWLGLSIVALVQNKPSSFERLGSLGVAVVVAGFAMNRAIAPVSAGSLAFLQWLSAGSPNSYVASIRDHPTALSEAIKKSSASEGEQAALEDLVKLYSWRRRIDSAFQFAEVTALFFATFQWGYGSCFARWFNGHGWQPC
jgi:hypothetical protein